MSQAFEDFFAQFDASRMTQEHLDTILEVSNAAQQMAESFKQLGGPFEPLTMLSVEARAGILDMVGGLDQFMQKTAGYVNNFYSEEERQALSLASVDKTLTGVGLNPDSLKTKADFRALVESLNPNDPTQAKQLAALLNSQEAFNFGVGLLEATGMTLGQITANAPDNAGVDLMVEAQATTNSLLSRIEAAIRETGAQTVAAVTGVPATVVTGTGGSDSGSGEVTTYDTGFYGGGG
jgi:hypothetical protein